LREIVQTGFTRFTGEKGIKSGKGKTLDREGDYGILIWGY